MPSGLPPGKKMRTEYARLGASAIQPVFPPESYGRQGFTHVHLVSCPRGPAPVARSDSVRSGSQSHFDGISDHGERSRIPSLAMIQQHPEDSSFEKCALIVPLTLLVLNKSLKRLDNVVV